MTVAIKTVGFTLIALIAFASNSLLTRLALGSQEVDAATFTFVRLAAGAVVLLLIVGARPGTLAPSAGRGVVGPVALFAYAAPFSFAYLRIGAATGALVLFGVVQLTMIGYAMLHGERPTVLAWLGVVLATGGLVVLTVPSATQPDPLGVALMGVAGVAWAVYSLAGRTSLNPLAENARSFLWGSLPALLVVLVLHASVLASAWGIALALISGGVTSGMGYALWYRVLPRLSVTQAAVAQLSVPVIAAVGAALLLQERLSVRFVVSGAAVLCGVGIVLSARSSRV